MAQGERLELPLAVLETAILPIELTLFERVSLIPCSSTSLDGFEPSPLWWKQWDLNPHQGRINAVTPCLSTSEALSVKLCFQEGSAVTLPELVLHLGRRANRCDIIKTSTPRTVPALKDRSVIHTLRLHRVVRQQNPPLSSAVGLCKVNYQTLATLKQIIETLQHQNKQLVVCKKNQLYLPSSRAGL